MFKSHNPSAIRAIAGGSATPFSQAAICANKTNRWARSCPSAGISEKAVNGINGFGAPSNKK